MRVQKDNGRYITRGPAQIKYQKVNNDVLCSFNNDMHYVTVGLMAMHYIVSYVWQFERRGKCDWVQSNFGFISFYKKLLTKAVY